MIQPTVSPDGLRAAADHLLQAARQLRRFGAFGFRSFSEPAAIEVEKLANALRAVDEEN